MDTEITIDDYAAEAGLPQGRPRRVTVHGTPVLHRPCQPVTVFDADLRQLVADMLESMDAAEGVGLAANQIGVDARVFVYDCPDAEGTYRVGCVANPVLLPPEPGVELDTNEEGCLSVPLEFAPLARPAVATVTGVDLDGRPITVTGTGLFARCLQHETDHLNGTLYVDRLEGTVRETVLASLAERLAAGGAPPWSAAFTSEATS